MSNIYNPSKRKTQAELFFVPRMFAQHPFPKSDIDKNPYWAANGDKVLIISEGHEFDHILNKPVALGLPFGMIPRLMLLEISTEAKRTGKREIFLAENITRLLKKIKYEVSGGESGSIEQLNNQVKRLLNCRISYEHFRDIRNPKTDKSKLFIGPVDEINIWESIYDEERMGVKNIKVKLQENFFNEIMHHAFPVKRDHIHKLRPSTLAIDLYLFVSHRVFNLTQDVYISWKDLNKQFGSNYTSHLDFGRRARKYLKRIKRDVYPELEFSFKPGRLVLKKSPTPVKKLSTFNR